MHKVTEIESKIHTNSSEKNIYPSALFSLVGGLMCHVPNYYYRCRNFIFIF